MTLGLVLLAIASALGGLARGVARCVPPKASVSAMTPVHKKKALER